MDNKTSASSICQRMFHITMACLAIAMIPALSGCGGGSSAGMTNTNPPPPSPTAVQVNMGDSPADWMLGFSMNISSMTLTGSNGNVTVVSTATPMEMTHLMGSMQPLAMVNAPMGSYTGATVTIGSATVTYIKPGTTTVTQQTIQGPINGTVTFSSPVTVGSTPMAMNFDLNLASSVTGTAGSLMMNPVFAMTSGQQGSGNAADYSDGGIQEMMGSISGVSGSSFTMTSPQSSGTFTFATNASTTFSGVASTMSGMSSGMLVLVDATLQSDGSLLATNVQSMIGSGGMMGSGMVATMSSNSLSLVMQNGVGNGMMASYFGDGATVNLSANTTYAINNDGIGLSGLPFTPVFNASHVYVGQNVMPISSGGMMGASGGMMGGSGGMMGGGVMSGMSLVGTIPASELVLMPQGLSGTSSMALTSGAAATFTLALPSDSAFTSLTGATSITVYQQTGTILEGGSTIASGTAINVFGLLFNDGGQWKMVAVRIGANN